MSTRTADEVFADHLRWRQEGDLGRDVARDFADDVVLLTGDGVFRGHDGVRVSAGILRRQMPNADYTYHLRLVEGALAFLEWGATSERGRIEDGADSFLIRDGKIQGQTIHYTIIPTGDG